MAIPTSEIHSQYEYMRKKMQHDFNYEMELRMREQEKGMYHAALFKEPDHSSAPVPQLTSNSKSNSKLILLCEDI